jgi:hypothetical protein
VVSVLHRPVEFASKSGRSQLAALGPKADLMWRGPTRTINFFCLAECPHAEAQRISFPALLLHLDHRSEVTVGAGEPLFDSAERLDFPDTMADDDCDDIAHGNWNLHCEVIAAAEFFPTSMETIV